MLSILCFTISDETPGSKVLYSDCLKAQGQSEMPQNLRNSINQQPQQQQHMSSLHQAVMQESLDQPIENKATPVIQSVPHPKPMGNHSLQSYQNNIPPRMQQQHHQSAANARMQSAQKSTVPPQRDSSVGLSPISDATTDGERDGRITFGGQIANPADKRVNLTRASPKLMLNNEIVSRFFPVSKSLQ